MSEYIENMSREQLTLRIYVPSYHANLIEFYKERIDKHNEMIYNDKYADSGFDLGLPQDFWISKKHGFKIPLGIHCSMYKEDGTPQAFSLLPRSSIVKTPLRLSNSVGVIDRGYRGPITAVVDDLDFGSSNIFYKICELERYFQIVHPSYNPFKVVLVYDKTDLGTTTRDECGFGSTGT